MQKQFVNSQRILSKPNLSNYQKQFDKDYQADNNNYKKINETKNDLNQSNYENLIQTIKDQEERIKILMSQIELYENQQNIIIQHQDQEIQVYKEIIFEYQQKSCSCFRGKQNQQQQQEQEIFKSLEQILIQRKLENDQLINKLQESNQKEKDYLNEIEKLNSKYSRLQQEHAELTEGFNQLNKRVRELEEGQEDQEKLQIIKQEEIDKQKNEVNKKPDNFSEYYRRFGANQFRNSNNEDEKNKRIGKQNDSSRNDNLKIDQQSSNREKQKINESENRLKNAGNFVLQSYSQTFNISQISEDINQKNRTKLKLYFQEFKNSYTHDKCKKKAYLTNQGLITCDGNCKIDDNEIYNWYFDSNVNQVISINQCQQIQQLYQKIQKGQKLMNLVEICLNENYIHGQKRSDFISSIENSLVYKKLQKRI